MKIAILGWYGVYNLGDETILQMIAAKLRSIRLVRQITPLTFRVSLLLSFSRNIELKHRAVSRLAYWRNLINTIRSHDALVIGGGGILNEMSGSQEGLTNIDMILKIVKLARKYNTPVIFYAIGVGPIFSKKARQLAASAIKHAEVITVRDSDSRRILESLKTGRKIHSISDPAFLLKAVNYKTIEPMFRRYGLEDHCGPRIGVALRDWYPHVPNLPRRDYELLYNRLIGQTAKFLDLAIERFDADIFFIPIQWVVDRGIARQVSTLVSRQERIHLIEEQYSGAETLAIIKKMDLMFAMRLHAVIFAANAGVPTLAISYDPKVASFMDALGNSSFSLKPEETTTNKLMAVARKLMARQQFYRGELTRNWRKERQKAKHGKKLMERFLTHAAR